MNNSKPQHNNWDPCHPGLIQEAAQDLAASRRRVFRIVGTCLAVITIGGVAVVGTILAEGKPRPSQGLPAGIACITVIDQLPALFSDDQSDEQLKKRITYHIMKCPSCREAYNKMCCSKSCKSRPAKATIKPCENSPSPSPTP